MVPKKLSKWEYIEKHNRKSYIIFSHHLSLSINFCPIYFIYLTILVKIVPSEKIVYI